MDDRDPAAAEAETEEVVETAAPKVDKASGVALDGAYPHNHRLRAEAIAKDGKEEDPDGLITPELIADAKARLEAEEEAERIRAEEEAKLRPPVHAGMRVAELERIAGKEGVDLSSASNNDDRVRLIEEHRAANPNPQPPPPPPSEPTGTTEPTGDGDGETESEEA